MKPTANVAQLCDANHVWTAAMKDGGDGMYLDAENGPVCPECGGLDIGDPEKAVAQLRHLEILNTIPACFTSVPIPHVGPQS